MTSDDELLERFHRRLAGIEPLVKDPRPWPARVRGTTRLASAGRPARSQLATIGPVIGGLAILIAVIIARLLAFAPQGPTVGASLPVMTASASVADLAGLEVVASRANRNGPTASGIAIVPTLLGPLSYTITVRAPDGTVVVDGRIDDPLVDPRSSIILRAIVVPPNTYRVDVSEQSRSANLETGADVTNPTGAACGTVLRLEPQTSTTLLAAFEWATCSFDQPRTIAMSAPLPTLSPERALFPGASSIPTSGPDLVSETIARFRITHPASWRLVAGPTAADPFGIPIFYLSTEELTVGPCFTPNPSGEYQGCAAPLRGRHLSPNGVLMTVTPNPGLAEITPPQVNDIVPLAPGCRGIGADEEKEVVVNGTVVVACLRGPDLGALDAGFRGVVSSMDQGSH